MAAAREHDEQDKRRRLTAGEPSLDAFGLRESLTRMGVEWVDDAR